MADSFNNGHLSEIEKTGCSRSNHPPVDNCSPVKVFPSAYFLALPATESRVKVSVTERQT